MRALALRGTTVKELVTEVRTRLGYGEDTLIPVLWYFQRAFCLPLTAVLPIREWVGTDRDEEIDAVILPAITKTRDQWATPKAAENGTADSELNPGLTAAEQRS
jgi:hypothetical protein